MTFTGWNPEGAVRTAFLVGVGALVLDLHRRTTMPSITSVALSGVTPGSRIE